MDQNIQILQIHAEKLRKNHIAFSLENVRKIEELLKAVVLKTQDPEVLPSFKAIR